MLDFIKNISPIEIGAIALILTVFFGSKVVTSLGRTGGETFKEIKKIKKSITEALGDDDNTPHKNDKEAGT